MAGHSRGMTSLLYTGGARGTLPRFFLQKSTCQAGLGMLLWRLQIRVLSRARMPGVSHPSVVAYRLSVSPDGSFPAGCLQLAGDCHVAAFRSAGYWLSGLTVGCEI